MSIYEIIDKAEDIKSKHKLYSCKYANIMDVILEVIFGACIIVIGIWCIW